MKSFEEALIKSSNDPFPKEERKVLRHKKLLAKQKKKKKAPNVQEQKYALVPMWRQRRAGKTGEKK